MCISRTTEQLEPVGLFTSFFMSNSVFEAAQQLAAQVVEWRREIHRHAELSFEEHRTSALICQVLDQHGIPYKKVAGTGVLARIDGRTADPIHPVVLRADMDALPITEASGLPFACTDGAMHACGHDLHTSALLGALVLLQARRETFDGTILGLFQPGEELWPGGASIVLKEGVFDGMEPRAFVGGHVSPELKVGQIGLRSGTFMASTDEIHITVHGKGGHGGLPHLLKDPVLATSAMIVAMQQIVSRNNYAFTPSVLSFGRVIADGATNIIPDQVEVEGTFRTMDEEWRKEAHRRIREVAEQTTAAYGCTAEVDLMVGYPCVLNDERLTATAREVAAETFGTQAAVDIPRRMTAEDFGSYSVRYPSVFFRWGVECDIPLHNAAFVADERAIPYGVAMLAAMALRLSGCAE